jgi:hypothetical protein
MSVEWNQVEGNLNDVRPTIQKKLNGYLRNYDRIKIGGTTNPEVRWRRGYAGRGWKKMVVLHEGPYAGTCRSLEKALISYAKGTNFRVKPDNVLPGGENIEDGKERYYVYVVVDA